MKPTIPDFTRDRPHQSDSRFWDRQLRARIGQDLRVIFEEMLKEPLPERISRPLVQMEEGNTDSGGGALHQIHEHL